MAWSFETADAQLPEARGKFGKKLLRSIHRLMLLIRMLSWNQQASLAAWKSYWMMSQAKLTIIHISPGKCFLSGSSCQ